MNCAHCEGTQKTTLEGGIVCDTCGREEKPPLITSLTPRDWMTEPIMHIYSRKKRFAHLFDKLCFPAPDAKDEQCLRYLETKKLLTFKDLITSLKKSKLKDKRYCSLHTFSRLFVRTYQEPTSLIDVFRTKKVILHDFERVEFAHRKLHTHVPFFNYPWLLQKLLTVRGITRFNRFIKQIKCKRRTQHYEDMFQRLMPGCKGPLSPDTV